MYVRGGVARAGRHTSVPGPARKNRDVCQTEDVPVLPARTMFVAATARQRGPNDGTLSVKEAHGMVTIQGRGAVIGSFAQGRVTISDPIDGDGTGPIVTGDEWSKDRNDTTTTWGGTKVRFRMIGG